MITFVVGSGSVWIASPAFRRICSILLRLILAKVPDIPASIVQDAHGQFEKR